VHVFISWSGQQAHAFAIALRSWLPKVLAQKVSTFVSSEDIAKGARGLSVIASELENSSFGIVVVTRTNLTSSWINFEAGAIGKSVSNGMVAPLLLGLTDSDLDGPLKQFQNTVATDKEAVRALVHSINALHEDPLDGDAVNTLFDANWPSLEQDIDAALKLDASTPEPRRSTEDILDEVLTTVRSLQREFNKLSSTARVDVHSRAGIESGEPANREPGGTGTIQSLQLASNALESILPLPASAVYQSPRQNQLVVELPDGYPVVSASVLDEVRALAGNLGIRIVLAKNDGTAVRMDEAGLEARRVSGGSEWLIQLTGTESDF
jgi:hypothetical protein